MEHEKKPGMEVPPPTNISLQTILMHQVTADSFAPAPDTLLSLSTSFQNDHDKIHEV